MLEAGLAFSLLCSTILILSMYSFLWKTNPFYTLSEGMFIGILTASQFTSIVGSILNELNAVISGSVLRIIPVIVGILFFVGALTKYRWVMRYPNAILTGGGLGVLFALSIRGQLINQISSTVMGVVNSVGPSELISNVIIFLGTLITLSYFFYRKPTGRLSIFGQTIKIAPLIMSISFGISWAQISLVRFDNLIASFRLMLLDFLLKLF